MRVPAGQRISRRIALLAAIGLHLLGVLLIGSAFHAARTAQPLGSMMVWIGWPTAPPAQPRPEPTPRARALAASAATMVAPLPAAAAAPPAATVAPLTTTPAAAPHLWAMEAERAAAALIARATVGEQRKAAMGAIPKSPYAAASAAPAFPWSRQPLGKHFDADLHTGLISLRNNRCMIGVVFILPVFGCAIGHLDPDPGDGDLFDPRYRPAPLELPASLDTVH